MPVFETNFKNEVVFLKNKKDKEGNCHLEVKRIIHETPEAIVKELINHGEILMSSTINRSFSFEAEHRRISKKSYKYVK